ncbi:MAG TPA: putative Ig domain-containing protein [Trebonia sp.]|jgi:DNA-binding beta-propeller fold protein YncE
MRQYRRAWSQSRQCCLIRTGALIAAGLLVAALGSAGSASAAASAGYTASFVPAGPGDSLSVSVNPVTDTVYVGESTTTGYELVAIDGSSHAIEATIPLPTNARPISIAVNSATNTIYVATGAQLLVIDGATNSLSGNIPVPARAEATRVAVDSATNVVYVLSPLSASVLVIDGSTNTLTTTFSTVAGGAEIAVDETTDVIWVNCIAANLVVAISGTTGSIFHSVSVNAPTNLAVNPVTDRVYVAPSPSGNALTVIDGATGAITATVPITTETQSQIAVDPSADVVFARGIATVNGSAAGGMVAIDGATNTVTDVLNASGTGAVVDTATGTLYETASIPSLISPPSPGIWAITPSVSNAISPLVSGPAAAVGRYGANSHVVFSASGLPAPAFSETGPLPAGVTLSAGGVLSGTPQAGSAGVYPITITASNGIAPDSSMSFTLTITPGGPQPVATSNVVQVKNRATGKCLNEDKNTGLLSTYTCLPGTYVSLRWQVVTYSDGSKDLVSVQTGQSVRDNGLNKQLSLTGSLSPMRFQNGGIFRFADNLVIGVNRQGNFVPVIGSPSYSSLNNVRWDFGSVPA